MAIPQSTLQDAVSEDEEYSDVNELDIDNMDDDDDMDEATVMVDTMHQSMTALAVIRQAGRVPSYMKMVTHGSPIAYCFESSDMNEVVTGLEDNVFGGTMAVFWENMKARFANMRSRIATSLVTIAGSVAIASDVAIAMKRHAISKKMLETRRIDSDFITTPGKTTYRIIKESSKFKLGAVVYSHQGGISIINRLKVTSSLQNKIGRRHTYKLRRIMRWAVAIWMIAYAAGKLTRNTPSALDAMIKLALPTTEEGFNKYMLQVASIMNTQTHFRLNVHSGSQAADIKHMAITADTPSIDPEKISEYLKDRADAMKRFQSIPDKLSALVRQASDSNNIWSLKGATFTAGMCRAIIYECTNPTGAIDRILAHMDKLMDSFHSDN